MSGICGGPPPPTTKAANFYRGGCQSQILLNVIGYGTAFQWMLLERQAQKGLKAASVDNDLSVIGSYNACAVRFIAVFAGAADLDA